MGSPTVCRRRRALGALALALVAPAALATPPQRTSGGHPVALRATNPTHDRMEQQGGPNPGPAGMRAVKPANPALALPTPPTVVPGASPIWSIANAALSNDDEASWAAFTAAVRANATLHPRMLVGEGCEGSTVYTHLAIQLMQAHGAAVTAREYEQTLCDMNPNCKLAYNATTNATYQRTIEQAIRMTVAQAARDSDRALVFKGNGYTLAGNRRMEEMLQALGTEMVYVKRGNRLDTVICGVKDCFDTEAEAGFTVDPRNGSRISMCFERRDLPADQQPMAFLNTTKLTKHMQLGDLKTIGFYQMLTTKHNWTAPKPIKTEDIFAYEASSETEAMDRSVTAFSTLIGALGVPPNEWIIRTFLAQQPDLGERPPAAHKGVIYNHEEVYHALLVAGPWYSNFYRPV